MTDQQLLHELAERRLQQLLDRSAATALHTAAVMARSSWIETFNGFKEATQGANADDVCREMAAALSSLNRMVDRSAALLENKE